MKIAIILFPGTNREKDMARAMVKAGAPSPDILWHKDHSLKNHYDLIVIGGGFSFGDYLRTGAIAARSPIMSEIKKAADKGVPILGVCNGFQILIEAQLLPGILMRNSGLNFICKDVALRVENNDTLFTTHYQPHQNITIPVAHHDGNYFADDETLKRIEGENQIVFRYGGCFANGMQDNNPNGSAHNIAGLVNERGNVLGMMPHPENAIETLNGTQDGLPLFTSLFENLKA